MSTMPPLLRYLSDISHGLTPALKSASLDRLHSKLKVFLDLTKALSTLSTCKRTGSNIGCVIVPPDLSGIMAIGYNGPPAGFDNDSCRGPEAVGSCGCIHAEANALVKRQPGTTGLVLITTLSPCEHCAGLIINSKAISAVLYQTEYRDRSGILRLEAVDISAVSADSLGMVS